MKIILDLDGTICSEEKFENRQKAKLLDGAKKSIDILKKKNKIIIYSARGWHEYNQTFRWLKKNKIYFDQLILGKPIGDVWIDDRAIRFNNWKKIIKKISK